MNRPYFIGNKINVPWSEGRKEIPYHVELQNYIIETYFDNFSPDENTERTTPSGNGFDYTIIVDPKKELWKDYEWVPSVNYIMSDLNVGQKKGNHSFFFVKDYRTRYRGEEELYYEFDITLDEWATFNEEILEGFKGSALKTGGHEHEWNYNEEGDYFTPAFKENNGLLICDEVCQRRNNLFPVQSSFDKTRIGEDWFVLFFTKPDFNGRIDITDLSSSITPTENSDPSLYKPFLRPNTSPTIITGSFVEDYNSGYVIKLLKVSEIKNIRLLNNLIYILENNPFTSGLNNLFATITNSSSYYKDSKKTTSRYSVFEQLKKILDTKNLDFADDFLGGDYKLNFIKQITLPYNMEKNLIKKVNIAFSQQHTFNENIDKKNILFTVSDITLINCYEGIQSYEFLESSFLVSKEVENGTESNFKIKEGLSPLRVKKINISDAYSEKKVAPFSKNYIIDNQITPHLLTANHYEMNFKSINENITLNQSDLFWENKRSSLVSVDHVLVLNSQNYGYINYINTNSEKWLRDINFSTREFSIDSLRNTEIPFLSQEYNDWLKSNTNQLETSRINIHKQAELERREAKRQFIGSMVSGIMRTGISIASAALTGGASVALAGAQAAVATSAAVGQAGIGVAKAGMAANTGNAVGAGAGGIIGSIIARKNAVDEARTKEQNSIRSLNAQNMDAKNIPGNVSGDIGIKGEYDISNITSKKATDDILFWVSELSEIDKNAIKYDRNIYGSSVSKKINFENFNELLTHIYWTALRLENLEVIISGLKIPTIVKRTLEYMFNSLVIVWDMKKANNVSFFDYNQFNYDKILLLEKEDKKMENQISKFDTTTVGGISLQTNVSEIPFTSGTNIVVDITDIVQNTNLLGIELKVVNTAIGGKPTTPEQLFDHRSATLGKSRTNIIQDNDDYTEQYSMFGMTQTAVPARTWKGTFRLDTKYPDFNQYELHTRLTTDYPENCALYLIEYYKNSVQPQTIFMAYNNGDIKTLEIDRPTRINIKKETKTTSNLVAQIRQIDGLETVKTTVQTITPVTTINTPTITQRNEETYDIDLPTTVKLS